MEIEKRLCSVCGKRKVRFVTTSLGSLNYGFCGKICLANNTIRKYKLKDLQQKMIKHNTD